MTFAKSEIYALAKTLFVPAEWPYIESCLETMSLSHSRVLHNNGALAAFVIINKADSGNAFISYCGVCKTQQGKGFGSKLLKETLTSIFQVDFYAAQLYVDNWNNDARRLYERLGFKGIGGAIVAGSECTLMEITRDKWLGNATKIVKQPTLVS